MPGGQVLLPHLAARCAFIKPSTLAGLLRDPGSLVPRLISLRQLLPGADIGQVAAAEPELLLLRDLEALQVRSPSRHPWRHHTLARFSGRKLPSPHVCAPLGPPPAG